jgi:uncharacterized protein (DUF1778 family)
MDDKQTLTERVPVQMTPDQRKILETAAARAGLGLSPYMRQASLYRAALDGGKE